MAAYKLQPRKGQTQSGMNPKNSDFIRRRGYVFAVAFGLMMALAVASLLSGCSPKARYVPVETARTEYVNADTASFYDRLRSLFESMYSREVSSDSVIDRQKETVTLKENGDTARHDRERVVYVSSRREKELEHQIKEQDSIIGFLRMQLASVKTDSIPVPYPVERKLSRWEQTKMDFGGFAIGALAIVLCAVVVWLIRKFRK